MAKRTYSKSQLQEKGAEIAKRLGVKTIHATSDGQFFKEKSYCNLHASEKKLNNYELNYADQKKEKDSKQSDQEKEAQDLTTVKGVGKATAVKLTEAGIENIEALASADANALAEQTGIKAELLASAIEEAKAHIAG